MKNPLVLLAVLAAAITAPLAAQGTFPPASGPTTPVMKTLDQIEPRKPLSGGADPVGINSPGSYYLTGNITLTTTATPITISASDVTLDLNGFTVSGNGDPSAVNTYGINIISGRSNVTIRNGSVVRVAFGIITQSGEAGPFRIEGVKFNQCSMGGIRFGNKQPGSVITGCSVANTGGNTSSSNVSISAIYTTGGVRVENCHVDKGTATGSGTSTGLNIFTGDFAINNSIANFTIGISYGKYRDNLFYNVTTPMINGTDAGGNN